MIAVSDILCPESKTKFESISLSRRTVVCRIACISEDLTDQLGIRIKSLLWYSLALDESTDISDTAQLLIFIRGIDDQFVITEELLSVEHLKDTTTGDVLFESVSSCMERFGLPWDKLVNVTTDGAPSLTGKNSGLLRKMKDKVLAMNSSHSMLSLHCIIHQESLCKSVLNLKHVVDPVVRVVTFIKARGLNHRQFKSLLSDLESEYSDVLYHTNVRWLSLGKVLQRVWNLREEIVMFIEMKNTTMEFSTQMKNREWQFDSAFAVDIIAKLNELNLKLQGRCVSSHELYAEVKSFQVKLMLFSRQLKEHNYAHFPTLQLQTIATQSAAKYSQQLSHLNEEFVRRFADFKLLEKDFALLTVPFTIDIDSVPVELQLELIDLQK
ncbi:hypothetical protein ACJMK2_023466 [Sinanodonta woodiana]|uniref:Uncharacterized protein n=1 Tax=Sinanodonta woodiana TaxID=1069815 RepID=A0ABD3T4B2_SINWO